MLKSYLPALQNVTLFGDRAFNEAMKINRDYMDTFWSNMTCVFRRRRDEDTDMCKYQGETVLRQKDCHQHVKQRGLRMKSV